MGPWLCGHSRGEGWAKQHGQRGRISRATEVSGTRPCRPAAHKPKGLRGPTAPMRCADGMERDSEEGRPARTAVPSTPERGSGMVGGRLAQRRSGAETGGHQTGRRRRDGRRRIKAFRHLPESHRFCNRGNAERCFHGKGYVLRRERRKRQPSGLFGAAGSDLRESIETSIATAPRELCAD